MSSQSQLIRRRSEVDESLNDPDYVPSNQSRSRRATSVPIPTVAQCIFRRFRKRSTTIAMDNENEDTEDSDDDEDIPESMPVTPSAIPSAGWRRRFWQATSFLGTTGGFLFLFYLIWLVLQTMNQTEEMCIMRRI